MAVCGDVRGIGCMYSQLSELLKGVCKELKLHHKYATFWGVDLSTVRPSPATLAYTDFLMEVALDEKTVY